MSLKMELISPAGDFLKLKYALAYGADAVYAGISRFSLRARENDFSLDSLAEAVQYTHAQGKRIYVTLNIFPHNRKIPSIKETLQQLNGIKPDAVIISDPGVVLLARETCPSLPLHLSTQANTINWVSVKFWSQQGIRRIILSRELSLHEISEIKQYVPEIELEAFIHGAICIAYSGRCLLSSYFNRRDSNQGICANSCRWPYGVYKENPPEQDGKIDLTNTYYLEELEHPGELMPITEDEHGTYIMNSKDLSTIRILSKMKDAGIDGYKIEGRTKSLYYLSVITGAYRDAINNLEQGIRNNSESEAEVFAVANRGYITGFLEQNPGSEGQNFLRSHSGYQTHLYCGLVKETCGEKKLTRISPRNRFERGETLEVLSPEGKHLFQAMEIFSLDFKPISEVHGGGQDVYLQIPFSVPQFSLIRKPLSKEQRT